MGLTRIHQVFSHFPDGAAETPAPLAGGRQVATVNQRTDGFRGLREYYGDIIDEQKIPIREATADIGDVCGEVHSGGENLWRARLESNQESDLRRVV